MVLLPVEAIASHVRAIRRSFPSTKSENEMIIKDTESADIHTSTGPMRTYLFRPGTEGRYPGLVLYSEIFQVTGPIRRTAAMLASHGFVVAVPEIYHELEPFGTVLRRELRLKPDVELPNVITRNDVYKLEPDLPQVAAPTRGLAA